jgi:hypothetical protein
MATVTAKLVGGQRMQRHFKKVLAQLDGAKELRIGFLENAKYPDGTPVAQVAFWQEFGSSRFPARSFFRPMIAKESGTWGPLLARVLRKVGYDVEKAMHRLGGYIASQLTESIVTTPQPPLSEVTLMLRKMKDNDPQLVVTVQTVAEAAARVARGEKGATGTRAKPLIDSGWMQRNTGYELRRKR